MPNELLTCPACGAELPGAASGRQMRCPACGHAADRADLETLYLEGEPSPTHRADLAAQETAVLPATPAPLRDRLGRFQLRQLVQDGMIRAYRAHDPLLRRDVLLKVTEAGASYPAGEAARRELLHEARV